MQIGNVMVASICSLAKYQSFRNFFIENTKNFKLRKKAARILQSINHGFIDYPNLSWL